MPGVVIYSSDYCPYCRRAKSLLQKKGVAFDEICVDGRPDLRAEMTARAGRTTVPQIWINQQHVGGCDELHALEYSGELDTLLAHTA
ncbi:MAG TPA: glutaredoxin 3 [Pseudomonadales bacterium]|nr:glutaredoxin 3 [Pseudomonadales bacterium]